MKRIRKMPNDAAFARVGSDKYTGQYGLSKRELFAAMAMQAYIGRDPLGMPEHVADRAVAYADGLLAKLQEQEETPDGGG